MISCILTAFLLASVMGASVKDPKSLPSLTLPESFSVVIVKMSLSSGLVENIHLWETLNQSRTDYHNGIVRIIERDEVKYQIQPETTMSLQNEIVCHKLTGSKYPKTSLKDIIPLEKFKALSHENINDKDTTKFYYKELGSIHTAYTIWAEYTNENWVPVRLEFVEYNPWLSSATKHEVWDFNNFKDSVDEDVFNVDKYKCKKDKTVRHTMQSESVTKDLLFINPEMEEHVNHVFNTFKEKHNKHYANESEHSIRKTIFKNSMRLITAKNRQNLKYKLSINQFADRTPEEMTKYSGILKRPEGNIPFPYDEKKLAATQVPAEYDLRLHGLVSWVKNQGNCKSSYSFAVTSAIEGALARSNGHKLKTLSNQAVIDCSWGYGNKGCLDGNDVATYKWIMTYGIPTEAQYGEFTNQVGNCSLRHEYQLFRIKGFTDVTPNSVQALKVAVVNHGPITVAVNIIDSVLYYDGGILYDSSCSSTNLNHYMNVVGYGERDGDTFWILKNSWGPYWGLDGYMLISTEGNNCGVMTKPTYPVVY